MVIHSTSARKNAIDYRETAPAAATRDMFLGTDGKPDNDKSRNSALGIGVRTVAGLALGTGKYGSAISRWRRCVQPAIALARDGLVVRRHRRYLPTCIGGLSRWPTRTFRGNIRPAPPSSAGFFFDWAAQPYFTLITTFIFAPYFTSFVAPDPASGQALWGLPPAAAGLMIALMSPVLGAIADASGRRKPWIAGFGALLVIGASANVDRQAR